MIDIWRAAELGEIDTIRKHVILGTDINVAFLWLGDPCAGGGGTPLHFAVIGGQMEAAIVNSIRNPRRNVHEAECERPTNRNSRRPDLLDAGLC